MRLSHLPAYGSRTGRFVKHSITALYTYDTFPLLLSIEIRQLTDSYTNFHFTLRSALPSLVSPPILYWLVSRSVLWPLLTSQLIQVTVETSLGKMNILVPIAATSTISVRSLFDNSNRALDFGSMWYLIRPYSLCMWFLFVSTDTAVWLTCLAGRQASVLTSQLTTLPLTSLRDTTPPRTGLSPFGTLNFMSYIHHSRRTQGLRKHRGSVVIGRSELLASSPIQNFDNEKSKVNNKNIWLG